jgi:hypothetical protein
MNCALFLDENWCVSFGFACLIFGWWPSIAFGRRQNRMHC